MGIYHDPRGCGCYFLSVTMTQYYCSDKHRMEAARYLCHTDKKPIDKYDANGDLVKREAVHES